MPYWISRDGQKHGPYSLETLQRLLAEGKLVPADWVWLEGSPRWVPLVDYIATPTTEPVARAPQPLTAFQPPYFRPFTLIPPDLHWAAVFVLGMLTVGLFSLVWSLVMTNFVRELDHDNTARTLYIVGFIAIFAGNVFRVIAGLQTRGVRPSGTGILMVFAGIVCYITARFRMRRTLLIYYNSVEPIGLYLSDVMTFFFGLWYLQYHLSRIAKWKKTGYLAPQ